MDQNGSESSVTTGKTHKSFFSKHGLRQVVSQKRVRFQDGEYDLDLSYICPNVLAMGLPANGMDAMFRNNENDVASMLNKFHPSSYMIYNLAQKKYDYSLFDNRVQDLGWKDHHAPGLELLFQNVNSMCEFLKQDFKNVVIVHCKAGKGRTGTSIAALLVYCGMYRTPEEALKYFSYRRANTIDPKGGVTIPSQKRYIKYFANILASIQTPNKNTYKINSITLSGVPMYDKKNGAKLVCHVMHDTIHEIYNGKKDTIKLEPVTSTTGTFQAQGLQECVLDGDIMLKFAHLGFFNEEVKFRISFNTYMIEGDEIYWCLYRHDLDDAYKDDDVPSQFKVEIRMTRAGDSTNQLPAGSLTEWQKALKYRHMYQNMFTKMSYQASTVYDPANNIGDTMDDVPNFLSQPQQVINGVIIENQSHVSSMQSLEAWEQQQEDRFLQEQAQRGAAGFSNKTPTSGNHQPYTVNPLSPRNSAAQGSLQSSSSFCSPLLSSQPPPLPTKPKPSLSQWDAYFTQHQQNSMAPASILGVMLQVPQYQVQPSAPRQISTPPSFSTPSSPSHLNVGTVTPQVSASSAYPSYSSNNNIPPPIPPPVPLTPSAGHRDINTFPHVRQASNPDLLPPPPAPPNPNPANANIGSPSSSGSTLPPPPAPPSHANPNSTANANTGMSNTPQTSTPAPNPAYSSYYSSNTSIYQQQFQQMQSIQGTNATAPAPPLPARRPAMQPPTPH